MKERRPVKKFDGVGFAKQIQEADLPSFLSELRRAKENGFTELPIVFNCLINL